MKILITPTILKRNNDSIQYLVQNMIDLLKQAGHIVAISATKENNYRNANLYTALFPKESFPLFKKRQPAKTIEEFLFQNSIIKKQYLTSDISILTQTIHEFSPDLIIEINRPASLIITKKLNIPCWSIVHAADYRNRLFNISSLFDLNAILSENGLEQILKYVELRNHCQKKITFGPLTVQAFPDNLQVERIGSMRIWPIASTSERHIYISLTHLNINNRKLRKMLHIAYLGAPYTVYIHDTITKNITKENLHFLATEKLHHLSNSDICIHDGDEYLFNQCLAQAIPQLIITNQDYLRSWNAYASNRQGFGIAMNQSMLTMETLYETHQKLIVDDYYKKRAIYFQKEMHFLGDLTQLSIQIHKSL